MLVADRMRNNTLALQKGGFRLDIRQNVYFAKVMVHCIRLLWKASISRTGNVEIYIRNDINMDP